MKSLKKYVFFLFGIVLLLYGCDNRVSETQEAFEQEVGQQEYTELTLFSDVSYWNMPKWSLEEGSITSGISEKTGVTVDFIIPPQEADRQLSLLLLKDELPDIMAITDDTVMKQLIDSGKVWKLDELLEEYCPESHLLTAFPEDTKERLIEAYGGWYSYPSHMNSEDTRKIWKEKTGYYEELLQYRENTAIMWNRNIMEQVGLTEEDLHTESQVMAALELVQSKNLMVHGEKVIPLLMDGNNYQSFTLGYLNNSFGAEVVDENGEYKNVWRQPESKRSLHFVNLLLRNGYASTEQLAYDNESIRSLIEKNCVFCFIGNTNNTGMDAREWVSTGAIFSDTGSQPVVGINLTNTKGWMHTLISKSCEEPYTVAKFLDYMTSDEGHIFISYGQEGEDFYYDEDGFIRRTEQGKQQYEEKYQTGLDMWWNFECTGWRNSVIPIPDEGSEEESRYAIQTALARESYVYDEVLLGLSEEFWEENPEEAEIKSAVEAFQEEQILKIITAETEEEFERQYQIFQDGQEALGIVQMEQKINEQVQRNFQRYGKKIDKIN